MNELLAALIGAVAVVVVPAVAWFSQRLTQEGRLLLRINRLGAANALIPQSPEKAAFEVHIREAAAALNTWLDPDNRAVRGIQQLILGALFIVSVVSLSVAIATLQIHDVALTFPLGLVVGAIIAILNEILGPLAGKALLRRRLRSKEVEPESGTSTPSSPSQLPHQTN